MHFLLGGGGFEQPYLLLFPLIGPGAVAEQIPFQESQCRSPLKTAARRNEGIPAPVHRKLLRFCRQIRHSFFAQMKKLLLSVLHVWILPLPQRQRHGHLPAQLHKPCDDPGLDGGKTGKAVKGHHASRQQLRFVQRAAQNIQRLLGGNKIAADIFCKSFV